MSEKFLGGTKTPPKTNKQANFTNFVLSAICCWELFPLSSDWESKLFPLQARVCGFCTRPPLCGELFPIPGYVNFVRVLSHVESYFPYQSAWILYEASPTWRAISLHRVHGFCTSHLRCGELFPLPMYIDFVDDLSYVESYFTCPLIGWSDYFHSLIWRVISITKEHGICMSHPLCGELFPLPGYVDFVRVVSYVTVLVLLLQFDDVRIQT